MTHRSAVKNFWDEEELRRVYYPEAVALLKRVTGADRSHIFDHTLRRRIPNVRERPLDDADIPRQPANARSCRSDGDSGGYAAAASNIPMKRRHCFAIVSPSSICGGRSNRRFWMRRLPCATRAASRRRTSSPSDLVYRDRRGETYNRHLQSGPSLVLRAGNAQRTRFCCSSATTRATTARSRVSPRIRLSSIRPRLRTRRLARASSCARSSFLPKTKRPGIDPKRLLVFSQA